MPEGPNQRPGFFRLLIPADLAELPKARELMEEVGQQAGLPESRIFDLQVTVSEATANAIEHAASEVQIEAWLLPDRVIVEVTNDGVFQPGLVKNEETRRRGLGLPLMVSLADQVHVLRLPASKTRVSLTFFLEGYRPEMLGPGAAGEREIHSGDGESLYRNLVERSPDAILVHIDGTYVFANPAAARLFDASSPDELIGLKAIERLHPDDRELMTRRVSQVLGGDVAPPVEGRMLRLDGTPVPVESTGSRVKFGGRLAIQVIIRDITERKRADEERKRLLVEEQVLNEDLAAANEELAASGEELAAQTEELFERARSLSESEERFRSVLDSSLDGLYRVNLQTGRYDYMSPAFGPTIGHSNEEVACLSPEAAICLVHPDDLPRVLAALGRERMSAAGEVEYRIAGCDGQYRWISNHFSQVADAQGRLLHRYGVVRDVTEQRRAAEDLKSSEARLSFLIALSDAFRSLGDASEIQSVAGRLLGERLDADRVFYGEIATQDGEEILVIERDHHAPGVSPLTGRFPFKAFSSTDYDNYRAGRTVWSANTQADDREPSQREAYRAADTAAFIGVPLLKGGELVSVLGVLQRQPREWSAEEIGIAEETVGRTWQAVQHVRAEEALRGSEDRYRTLAEENERLYRQQLDIAEDLQLALLDIPSELGSLSLGHLYRSATEAARVGGDFYDVFEVKDGKIAVLIGDVSGHGIQAARTATLVKDVVHAFTHQSLRINEVLRQTNKLLLEKNLPGFVTVFLGILDQGTGSLRYASAGHPEALLRRASGEVEHLGSGTTPLGVYPEAPWKPHQVALRVDDLLVLYTDGVIEARRCAEFFGEERLEHIVKSERVSPQRLPQLILDQVLAFAQGSLHDDVAILALSLREVAGGDLRERSGG